MVRGEDLPAHREMCWRCFQPRPACYCQFIRPLILPFEFVILIHPLEWRRRVATGRMASLCLSPSRLIRGEDFSDHPEVNSLLNDPQRQNWILYPGRQALHLNDVPSPDWRPRFDLERRLTIFVIDGTWATARKTLRLSRNLHALPQFCFTPRQESGFLVRKQPRPGFLSSIEAIHEVIELLGPSYGFPTESRAHDHLIEIFQKMVHYQYEFARQSSSPRAWRGQRSSKPGSSDRGT